MTTRGGVGIWGVSWPSVAVAVTATVIRACLFTRAAWSAICRQGRAVESRHSPPSTVHRQVFALGQSEVAGVGGPGAGVGVRCAFHIGASPSPSRCFHVGGTPLPVQRPHTPRYRQRQPLYPDPLPPRRSALVTSLPVSHSIHTRPNSTALTSPDLASTSPSPPPSAAFAHPCI